MTKEDLRNMFQENAKRSEEAPVELREVIHTIDRGPIPEKRICTRRGSVILSAWKKAIQFTPGISELSDREEHGRAEREGHDGD